MNTGVANPVQLRRSACTLIVRERWVGPAPKVCFGPLREQGIVVYTSCPS